MIKLNLNIGPELDKAFHAIEDEPKNSELDGVLTIANYNDKERVPDAYMYLLKLFVDDSDKKGGEFYTPEGVKDVLVLWNVLQQGSQFF